MVLLSCFVDSFSGVIHTSPIMFGPCNLFCDSRMLAVLAWASRLLHFLCSRIMHLGVTVAVIGAIVIFLLQRNIGVMGWLGDIGH